MPFKPLNDEEAKELYRLATFYWQEALRCEQAKANLAGCVMLGSALETLLILMVDCFPEEAEATGHCPVTRGKLRPLLEWNLAELLRVAKAAKWLPATQNLPAGWNSRKARIGDYAEVVRKVRNLAHPTRYLEDHFRKRVTRKYLQRQFDLVLLCRDWLLERDYEAIRERMQKEGPG